MSTRTTAIAIGTALTAAMLGLSLPVAAAPVSSGGAGLTANAPGHVTEVRYKHRKHREHVRKHRRHHQHGYYRHYRDRRSVDTVGSLGYDGYGYAYNRFSGERYQSCVFDEGYGRTLPCDAGGGGGGRN